MTTLSSYVVVISPKRRADIGTWLAERLAIGPFETREAAYAHAQTRALSPNWEATVVPLDAVEVPA